MPLPALCKAPPPNVLQGLLRAREDPVRAVLWRNFHSGGRQGWQLEHRGASPFAIDTSVVHLCMPTMAQEHIRRLQLVDDCGPFGREVPELHAPQGFACRRSFFFLSHNRLEATTSIQRHSTRSEDLVLIHHTSQCGVVGPGEVLNSGTEPKIHKTCRNWN